MIETAPDRRYERKRQYRIASHGATDKYMVAAGGFEPSTLRV